MDKEGTRLIVKAIVISKAPDVCKSPTAPVPYMIVGKFNDSIRTATTVNMTSVPSFTTFSRIATVYGNEAGVGGGVVSQINKGMCKPLSLYSSTVSIEGNKVCRHDMLMEMNCLGPEGSSNTIGQVIYIEMLACANVSPHGEITVEKPEETPAASKPPPPESPPEKSWTEELGEMGSEAKDRLGQRWDETKQGAQDAWEYAKDRAQDPGKLIDDAKEVGTGIKKEVGELADEIGEKGVIDTASDRASEWYDQSDLKKDIDSGNWGGAATDGVIEAAKWILGGGAIAKGGQKVLEKLPGGKKRKKKREKKDQDEKQDNDQDNDQDNSDSPPNAEGDDGTKVTAIPPWKGPADYSKIADPQAKSRGPGKEYTKRQKEKILEENRRHNDGYLRSDKDGSILDAPEQSKKGVPKNMNQAEVDHVFPKSKGGANTYDNAQVLSATQNVTKSDKL